MLAQALGRLGIDYDLVEPLAGVLEIAALQGGEAEKFPCGVAEGAVQQRGEPLLQFGLAGFIHPQQGGAQAGDVAQQAVERAIGGERVQFLDGRRAVRQGAFLGRAQPRQRLIAQRRGPGEFLEGGGRGFDFVVPGQRLRRRIGRPGRLGARLALMAQEDKNGGSDHDRDGETIDDDGISRPQPLQHVRADVFIDFAENIGHFVFPLRLSPCG